MLDAEEILELFAQTEVDPDWSFAECGPRQTGKLSHGYHRYPAKFIPQLVERLFDLYLPIADCGLQIADGGWRNSEIRIPHSAFRNPHSAIRIPHSEIRIPHSEIHVNDLFMGSGTTIACAIARGYRASGTDINYAAALITRVKATPIEPGYLAERIQAVTMDLLALDTSRTLPLWPPAQRLRCLIPQVSLARINYWFDPATRDELGFILGRISAEPDEHVRDFLLCCFSHILKTVSRWDMGSTKPIRDRNKRPVPPFTVFLSHLRRMMRGNLALWKAVPPAVRQNPTAYLNIRRGDARQQPVEDNSVDLQVTSSPYVTSYEYADLHQLTTLWLAPDAAQNPREYRRQFIGTGSVKSAIRNPQSEIASRIVEKMAQRDPRTAAEIQAYFADMQECFQETARILKPGARCCYVIGNTTLRGVEILNAQAFAEGLQLAGLELERLIKREIPVKILPTVRDAATGRFASCDKADARAYPTEFIVIGRKPVASRQSPVLSHQPLVASNLQPETCDL